MSKWHLLPALSVMILSQEKSEDKESLGDESLGGGGAGAPTSVNSTLAGSPRMEPSGCL